jgi:branched-chain amino acid transport system substrate-binding protein
MTGAHRLVRFAAVAAVGALVLTACSSSKSNSPGTTAAGGGTTTTTVTNDWALQYTGGTAGKADPAKAAVVIGYVNQQGAVPEFPEATDGINAAVQYVNNELGGIQGHAVKLDTCFIQSEADGQKCGTQFENNDAIKLVITGSLTVGNQSLYNVLAGHKPVLISNPLGIPDFITGGTTALTPGAPGVVKGMAVFVAKHLQNVKKVAVVHGDSAAEVIGTSTLFKPLLAKLGIDANNITPVQVSDTAQSPEIQSAIQAAGADKADVIVPLVTAQLCNAMYDAIQALGIKATVVTSGLCFGTPMTKHLQQDLGLKDQVPNGWYFGDYGYSYFLPDAPSGMTTYLAKVHQYSKPDVEYTGFAGPVFANLLTAVKFYNQIGPDAATTTNLQQKLTSFKGPMMLVAGPMTCGSQSLYKSLCGNQMGIEHYKDGKWVADAEGFTNNPIDVTAYPNNP